MANPLDDSPEGAPAYASGPLAVKPPTVGAVRASGLSPDSYFSADGTPRTGIQTVPSAPSGGVTQIAQNLLARAAQGFSNLFGGTPPVTPAAPTNGATTVAGRTNALESGLNALELRSTGFKPTPNITVAANSAADANNAAFNARQAPTAAQYNALPLAQRQAIDNFQSLPATEKEKQPNFYSTMIAGGQ